MGYVKDIFTEAVEELEFAAATADADRTARLADFMEGKTESTGGILPKEVEATLRMEPQMFLESWRLILEGYAQV